MYMYKALNYVLKISPNYVSCLDIVEAKPRSLNSTAFENIHKL